MENTALTTPVLMVIFRRPDLTGQLIEMLRRVKPPRLYVAADGPRADRPGELAKCALARKTVEDNVDWPCLVFKDYSDKNIGAKRRVSSAVSWMFEHEEAGIILEDDCHPSESFCRYCDELLERYRDDERIMTISADPGVVNMGESGCSYRFSKYT